MGVSFLLLMLVLITASAFRSAGAGCDFLGDRKRDKVYIKSVQCELGDLGGRESVKPIGDIK